MGPSDDPGAVLPGLYEKLEAWLHSGERVLVHQEQVDDRLMGVVAGYLCWNGLVPEGAQTIAIVERLFGRQMGSEGRELVAAVLGLARSRPVPSSAGG